MAGPFGSGSRGGPFTARSKDEEEDRGGVLGLVENLAGDVKDSVMGLPMGVVQMVRHPVRSVETMAGATWQTGSPLFHGDFMKFGKQVYDHPLAPLLDVMTVFSLGAAASNRVARLAQAGGASGKAVEFTAGLSAPRAVKLVDPKEPVGGLTRHDLQLNLSTRPGRRAVQEFRLAQIEPNLPVWFKTKLTDTRYERAFSKEMSHRAAARNLYEGTALQAASIMKAGEALTDPAMASLAGRDILAGMFLNLVRHAPKKLTASEATLLKRNAHYRYVKAADALDTAGHRQISSLQRQATRWEAHRARHAEAAHSLPSITKQLDAANDGMRQMQAEGWTVAGLTGRGGQRIPAQSPGKLRDVEFNPLVEQQSLVKNLEAMKERARNSKRIHDKATEELGRLTGELNDWQKRSFRDFFEMNDIPLEDRIRNLGQWATTRNPALAAKDAKGNLLLVPLHDAKMLGREGADSVALVKYAWHMPTTFWKSVMIGYTPRAITNNAVGNWGIYAARQGGSGAVMGIVDAVRITHGDNVAAQFLTEVGGFRKKQGHWTRRYFGDELGNAFRTTLADEKGRMPGKVAQGFYPLVHKVSDEPVRIATLAAYLRKDPRVAALVKDGMDFDRAASKVLKRDPELRQAAANHVRTIAGDYFTVNKTERVVRDLVPFYLWDRHIVKTAFNLVLDQPGRIVLAQQVSNMGIEETEELLGQIPEFLRGAVPFGKDGGKASVLLTASLNPFATLGELAGAGEAAIAAGGGRAGAQLLSQANPILTNLIEQVTGRDILSGGPVNTYGGVLSSIPIAIARELPPAQLIESLVTGTTDTGPTGKSLLFQRSPEKVISSLFGVPLRRVDLARAAEIAKKEQQERRRKRLMPKAPGPFG